VILSDNPLQATQQKSSRSSCSNRQGWSVDLSARTSRVTTSLPSMRISAPSLLRLSLVGFLMPYMDSLTDETGIDVQSCFAATLDELVGMLECREEVEVSDLPAALAPKPAVWDHTLRGLRVPRRLRRSWSMRDWPAPEVSGQPQEHAGNNESEQNRAPHWERYKPTRQPIQEVLAPQAATSAAQAGRKTGP